MLVHERKLTFHTFELASNELSEMVFSAGKELFSRENKKNGHVLFNISCLYHEVVQIECSVDTSERLADNKTICYYNNI